MSSQKSGQLFGLPIYIIAIVATVVIVALLALVLLAPAPPKEFRVYVRSAIGPEAGASVEVYHAETFLARATTDARGIATFDLAELPKKVLTLKVSKGGFQPSNVSIDVTIKTSTTIVLEAVPTPTPTPAPTPIVPPALPAVGVLRPNPDLNKTVTEIYFADKPQPVKLYVSLRYSDKPETPPTTIVRVFEATTGATEPLTTLTTDTGTAVFEEGLVADTKARITAEAIGYWPATIEKTLTPPITTILLHLSRKTAEDTERATITVIDENGTPVPEASVFVAQETPTAILHGPNKTNPSGQAVFEVNTFATYYAAVHKPGYLPSQSTAFTGGESVNVTLTKATAANAANLTVFVRDEEGIPITGAQVTTQQIDGTFLLPSQTTLAGRTVFKDLPRGRLILVKASYQNKVGEEAVALEAADQNATIVIMLRIGTATITAFDLLTKSQVSNIQVFGSAGGAVPNVTCSNPTGASCDVTLKAGITYEFVVSSSNYYNLTFYGGVRADEAANWNVTIVPKVNDTFVKLESLVDDLEPGVNIPLESELREGHSYKALFILLINDEVVDPGDRVGFFIRLGEGGEAWIRNILIKEDVERRNFTASAAHGCAPVPPTDPKNPAVKWIDINFVRGGLTQVHFLVEFVVQPGSGATRLPIYYRSYAIKDKTWLRNPYDEILGAAADSPARPWCWAMAFKAVYKVTKTDLSCSQYACIATKFVQDDRRDGEGFFAYNDRPVLLHYSVEVGEETRTGNRFSLTWQPAHLKVIAVTYPSIDAMGLPVQATLRPIEQSGSLEINVDNATKRPDYIFAAGGVRRISGTVTLLPKPGIVTMTKLMLKFVNGDGNGASHPTWLRTGYSPEAFMIFSFTEADLYCNIDNTTCITLKFVQGDREGGSGFTAQVSEVDPLGIRLIVKDALPKDASIRIALDARYLEALRGANVKGDDIGRVERNVFLLDVKESHMREGSSPDGVVVERGVLEAWFWARVKAAKELLPIRLEYKGIKPPYEANLSISPALVPVVLADAYPSSYELRLVRTPSPPGWGVELWHGGQLLTGVDEALDFFVDPIFPADAVYLVANFSIVPEFDPKNVVVKAPGDNCWRVKELPIERGAMFRAFLLMYDASSEKCANFEPRLRLVRSANYSPRDGLALSFLGYASREFALRVFAQCGGGIVPGARSPLERDRIELTNDGRCVRGGVEFNAFVPLQLVEVWDEDGVDDWLFEGEVNKRLYALVNNRQPVDKVRDALLVSDGGGAVLDRDGNAVRVEAARVRVFARGALAPSDVGAISPGGSGVQWGIGGWRGRRAVVESVAAATAFRRRSDVDKMFPFSVFNPNVKFKYWDAVWRTDRRKELEDAQPGAVGIKMESVCSRYGSRGIYGFWREFGRVDDRLGWRSGGTHLRLMDVDILDEECSYAVGEEAAPGEGGWVDLCGTLSFRGGACLQNCGDGWYYDLGKGESITLCDGSSAVVTEVSEKLRGGKFLASLVGRALEGYVSCVVGTCAASFLCAQKCDTCVQTCTGTAFTTGCNAGCVAGGTECKSKCTEPATATACLEACTAAQKGCLSLCPSKASAVAAEVKNCQDIHICPSTMVDRACSAICLSAFLPPGSDVCTESCIATASSQLTACANACALGGAVCQEGVVAAGSMAAKATYNALAGEQSQSFCDMAGAAVWDFGIDTLVREFGGGAPFGSAQYIQFVNTGGSTPGCIEAFKTCLVGAPWPGLVWVVGSTITDWLTSAELDDRAFMEINGKTCVEWWKSMLTYFMWQDCQFKAMWLMKEKKGEPIIAGILKGLGGVGTSLLMKEAAPQVGPCVTEEHLKGKAILESLVAGAAIGGIVGAVEERTIEPGTCKDAPNIVAYTEEIKPGESVTIKINSWGAKK